jgi:hypothetical protein
VPAFIDLTGKRYGRLTAIRRTSRRPGTWWRCKCRCGETVVVKSADIVSGNTRSCGCLRHDMSVELCKRRIKNIVRGTRFGNLTVLHRSRKKLYARGVCWVCRCDCGKVIICWGSRLRVGKHTHCGCRTSEIISKGVTTHGLSRTRIYRVLQRMIQRCHNPNHDGYFRYGGRGISVCSEWRYHPESFVRWSLANGYREGLTIDRIDNNKSYYSDNCRWIGWIPQARNRRDNHVVVWKGQKKTIAEWAEITGLKYHTISKRIIKYRWSVEEALTMAPSKDAWRRGVRVA